MTRIENHWFSSLARGYMSKWWTCTPMSPVAHVASVPSAGSRVHPREGEESREEVGRKPIWPRRLEHTDSWSTGLVTQGCIPLYLGGNGGLWLHISCKPSLGRTLSYDSVCKWILLLLESTHRQSKEDIRAPCRPVSQFGQILEAIHWSWGYTLF